MESEKITFNIGAVDLGQMDLLVEQGFYSNRTDFIRMAVRNQLNAHASDLTSLKNAGSFGVEVVERQVRDVEDSLKQLANQLDFLTEDRYTITGVIGFDKSTLERIRAAGAKIEVKTIGMLIITKDVSPELARAVFKRVRVYGIIKASDEVKKVLLGLKDKNNGEESEE